MIKVGTYVVIPGGRIGRVVESALWGQCFFVRLPFECNWYNVSELWPSNHREWLKTAWIGAN